MSIKTLLEQQMLQYDPEFEADARFTRLVSNVLADYIGEGVPSTDIKDLFLSRAEAEVPGIDGSVLADLFGKAVTPLIRMVRAEIGAALSRRRWDDETVLSYADLKESRDAFFVPPVTGTYSSGFIRAYFTSPRTLTLTTNNIISVPGDTRTRTYRPSVNRTYTAEEMSGNTEGGRNYIDVEVVATATGQDYVLSPGDGAGATGIPGATRLAVKRSFTAATAADDSTTLAARIRSALSLRTLATVAGANYILPSLGYADFYVADGGDALMLRDRLYGVDEVSGIPGGLLIHDTTPAPTYVSMGVAFDVWVPPKSDTLTTYRLANVTHEGLVVVDGVRGYLQEVVGVPSFVADSDFTADRIPDTSLFTFPAHDIMTAPEPASPPTVRVGDILQVSGQLDSGTGARIDVTILTISGDNSVTFSDADFTLTPWASLIGTYVTARVVRKVYDPINAPAYRPLHVPLEMPFLTAADGTEITVTGLPAVAQPGTATPELVSGAYVPKTYNYLDAVDDLPVISVERAEIVDSLSGQGTGEYLYPATPLFTEILEPRLGDGLADGTTPFRVRVHLPGPQASSLLYNFGGDGSNLSVAEYKPMKWPPDFSATYEVIDNGEAISESGYLRIAGIANNVPLQDALGNVVVGDAGDRLLREGDWVLLRPAGDSGSVGMKAFPIKEVSTTDTTRIDLYMTDLPVGETGQIDFYQGTSRTGQLLQGRGPEGTYYFDVFCQLISPLPTPLENQLPPSGTKVSVQPQVFGSQGYNICGVLPGVTNSSKERPHLSCMTTYAADGTLLLQRTLDLYGFTGDTVTDLQEIIDSDAYRPIGKSGLARMYPPSYVTCTFYYEGSFTPQEGADAVVERMSAATAEERLELSDLLDSVRDLGAGYVTSGRMFVLQMDHRRIWDYEATRGAVKIHRLSRPLPLAITMVKLKPRDIGEVVDETDPANQEEVFVYRYGGFSAD